MGILQKDTLRTTIISYSGLLLGYLNKGVLFVIFLTTDEIGLIGLLVSIGTLFAQFSNLGISYSVWRFFPFLRNKERQNYGLFQLSTLVTLSGIGIFTLVVLLFKDYISHFFAAKSPVFSQFYYWILPIGIAYSLFLTLDNFLRSINKNIVSVVATELILRIVVTFSVLMYAAGWINFSWLVILQSLSYVFPTAILYLQMYRSKELHWSVSNIAIPRRFRRIILSFSIYSYFNFIGILVVSSLDTIMLASIVGLSDTGIFSTIVYVASALQIPYKSLIRVTAPFVAKYWRDRDMKKMQEIYTRTSSIGLVIGLFIFLVLWVNRVEIFYILPGSFSAGMPALVILMIGRVVDMFCGINGIIFLTSKKFRYDLVFTAVLLIVTVLLNLWLIPLYGMTGAAFSTTVMYIVYNMGRLVFIYSVYRLHPFRKQQLWIFLIFCLAFLVFYSIPIMGNELVSLAIKTTLVAIFFVLPIYWLKLDMDVVSYMTKIKALVPAGTRNKTTKGS